MTSSISTPTTAGSCTGFGESKNHGLVLVYYLNNFTRGEEIVISFQEEATPNLEILDQVGPGGRLWLSGTTHVRLCPDIVTTGSNGGRSNFFGLFASQIMIRIITRCCVVRSGRHTSW